MNEISWKTIIYFNNKVLRLLFGGFESVFNFAFRFIPFSIIFYTKHRFSIKEFVPY